MLQGKEFCTVWICPRVVQLIQVRVQQGWKIMISQLCLKLYMFCLTCGDGKSGCLCYAGCVCFTLWMWIFDLFMFCFFLLFLPCLLNAAAKKKKKMETWETGDSWRLRPWAQEEMTENEWMNSPNPSKLDLICCWKGSENGTEPSLLSLYCGQGVTTNKCTSHNSLRMEGTAQNKVQVKSNRLRCRLV